MSQEQKTIVIIGDSHVMHFESAMRPYSHELRDHYYVAMAQEIVTNTPILNSGVARHEVNGATVYFIWRPRLSMSRVTEQYLNSQIDLLYEKFGRDIDLSNAKFAFHFGSVDLATKLKEQDRIDIVIPRYVSACRSFCEKFTHPAVLTVPITNRFLISEHLIDRFNYHLHYYAAANSLPMPIDIFDVIPLNFIPPDWDPWYHLEWHDCRKAVDYIISAI